jgi:hypothetical protein
VWNKLKGALDAPEEIEQLIQDTRSLQQTLECVNTLYNQPEFVHIPRELQASLANNLKDCEDTLQDLKKTTEEYATVVRENGQYEQNRSDTWDHALQRLRWTNTSTKDTVTRFSRRISQHIQLLNTTMQTITLRIILGSTPRLLPQTPEQQGDSPSSASSEGDGIFRRLPDPALPLCPLENRFAAMFERSGKNYLEL